MELSERQDLAWMAEYMNPAVFSIIVTFGILSNGTLIYIFLRFSELRKAGSILLINLAVSDILNLSISAPLLCIYHFPHNSPDNIISCRLHLLCRSFLVVLSGISLLALSIQRFCITFQSLELRFVDLKNTCSAPKLNAIFISAIWTFALLITLPLALQENLYAFLCGRSNDHKPFTIAITGYFSLFCIILPIIIISLSNITAKRLRKSVREISPQCTSSTQLMVRNRSAAIVNSLAWLFVFTQVPFHTWAAVCYWIMPDRSKLYCLIPEYIAKYMLLLNSCLNPVAVYFSSGAFRKLFKKCVRIPVLHISSVSSSLTMGSSAGSNSH